MQHSDDGWMDGWMDGYRTLVNSFVSYVSLSLLHPEEQEEEQQEEDASLNCEPNGVVTIITYVLF